MFSGLLRKHRPLPQTVPESPDADPSSGHADEARGADQAGEDDFASERSGGSQRMNNEGLLSNPFKTSARKTSFDKYFYFVGVPDGTILNQIVRLRAILLKSSTSEACR